MAEENTGQENFYICIRAPKTLRRNVLEASKSTLFILKQIYLINQLRNSKNEIIARIDKEIREIRILVQKIDDLMPKYNKEELKKLIPDLSTKKKQLLKKEKAETKTQEAPKPVQQPVSELDKLTLALDEIQKKLQNL